MSILIRGMDEIPEDGAVLVVKHDDNGKVYIKYAGMMGYSMELERIPGSHGDLIDRDALSLREKLKFIKEAEIQIYGGASWSFVGKCITAIEEAPTIIEAEGAEEVNE